MKIAITGHTKGIGKSFFNLLEQRGHDIIGFARSENTNIRRVPFISEKINECDLFINNAQESFAQTDLLYAVWSKWTGTTKWIWNISTEMTQQPTESVGENENMIDLSMYRTQKTALEIAHHQLVAKSGSPRMLLIRPGAIATQFDQQSPPRANVDVWTRTCIDIINLAESNNLEIAEFNLAPKFDNNKSL